ncbi:MAG: hypothetical protein LBK71_04170 [Verrucomicrobiales bacterium]|jgi:predicted RNase H-like nuclease (RuvC/YqgF family)|nr:hypothetical protein [Verrucomicrobiales bacterium]
MKKIYSLSLTITLTLWLGSCVPKSQYDGLAAKLAVAEEQHTSQAAQISILQNQLYQDTKQASKQLTALKNELHDAQTRLSAANTQNSALTGEIETLKKSNAQLAASRSAANLVIASDQSVDRITAPSGRESSSIKILLVRTINEQQIGSTDNMIGVLKNSNNSSSTYRSTCITNSGNTASVITVNGSTVHENIKVTFGSSAIGTMMKTAANEAARLLMLRAYPNNPERCATMTAQANCTAAK